MKSFPRILVPAALACTLLAPGVARADALNDTSADIHISTLGYGVAVSRRVAPLTDVRFSTGTLSYDRSYSSDGIDYKGQLRLANVAALLDVHPVNSAFRLTGGLLFGNDHLDVTGTPQSGTTYTINGRVYTAAQTGTLSGTAKFGSAAPYLGLGTGTPHRAGLYVTADAGVVFRSISTTLTATGPATSDPQFQADLAQARQNFQNQLNVLKTYPVVSLGLAARF